MQWIKSALYFFWAGLLEIGGGYLMWLWLREGRSLSFGIIGAIALALYGAIATLQPANFGRVYAAYGGVFIVMAMIWGWKIDGIRLDRFDLLGGAIVLLGSSLILFAPRT